MASIIEKYTVAPRPREFGTFNYLINRPEWPIILSVLSNIKQIKRGRHAANRWRDRSEFPFN